MISLKNDEIVIKINKECGYICLPTQTIKPDEPTAIQKKVFLKSNMLQLLFKEDKLQLISIEEYTKYIRKEERWRKKQRARGIKV